jgi:hypothetical protein
MSMTVNTPTLINNLDIAAAAAEVFNSSWRGNIKVTIDPTGNLTYTGWANKLVGGMSLVAEYVDEHGNRRGGRSAVGLKLNADTGFYESFFDDMDNKQVNQFKYEYSSRKIKSLAEKFSARDYKLMKEEEVVTQKGKSKNFEFVNVCGSCMA